MLDKKRILEIRGAVAKVSPAPWDWGYSLFHLTGRNLRLQAELLQRVLPRKVGEQPSRRRAEDDGVPEGGAHRL